jgi:O-phosphoseryl-tRNA(Cys) synthetase
MREHLLITTHMQLDLAADLLFQEIVNPVLVGRVDVSKNFPTTIQ